ncbi:choice-of-anchor X domain-containing protein [Hyalangium versicolor]|uniref:choice-of-anchor X domain-containing protein n=1 Tax=Hyalangium versicolor TaxID=2861190 RepID=UPI001CC8FBD5|nr:choice-of-anchor X domain-containing protein [Hyalangium versicolor]
MAVNTPAPAQSSRSRRALWLLLLVPIVFGGLWWIGSAGESGPDEVAGTSSAPGLSQSSGASGAKAIAGAAPGAPVAPGKAAAPVAPPRSREEEEREAQRAVLEKRLERAKFSLDSYVAGTRYPPESRPIREHPDQEQLASPERKQPLKRDGSSDVQLKLKQEKVFVAGDEVVHFYVGCENISNQPLPCQVTNATAHEAEHALGGQAPLAAVPLSFVDDGTQGDVLAGDGTFTTAFQPSKQGFPLYSGTLRISFQVRSGSAEGSAFFDILFTPSPPARFTGKVREAVVRGSLHIYVGLQVRTAGRYVLAGRVDDEAGVPFAYVSFNEEIPAGPQEVDFVVFGKLILDEAPALPLKLRDVEGFLLKERGDPDRELLSTLPGYVHTTREYPNSVFSSEEWQSEERSRYIGRFSEDVKEIQDELDALAGGAKAP